MGDCVEIHFYPAGKESHQCDVDNQSSQRQHLEYLDLSPSVESCQCGRAKRSQRRHLDLSPVGIESRRDGVAKKSRRQHLDSSPVGIESRRGGVAKRSPQRRHLAAGIESFQDDVVKGSQRRHFSEESTNINLNFAPDNSDDSDIKRETDDCNKKKRRQKKSA